MLSSAGLSWSVWCSFDATCAKGARDSEGLPSISLPRYVWPDVISSVTMWPCRMRVSHGIAGGGPEGEHVLTWASLRSLIGMPIVEVILLDFVLSIEQIAGFELSWIDQCLVF